jgi:hypothetical protein
MRDGEKALTGLVFGGASLASWVGLMIAGDSTAWWRVGGLAILAATTAAAWGMLQRRRWGLWLSGAVAVAILGVGGYAIRVAWTFWLFEEPTTADRIRAVLRPQIVMLIALPIGWLLGIRRPGVRQQFH